MKPKPAPAPKFAAAVGFSLVVLFSLFSLLIWSGQAGAQEKRTVQDVYEEAVKQFEAGQYAPALQGFQTVLKYQPNFVYARSYAAKCIEALRQGGGPKQTMEAKLANLVIPSVSFEAANLGLVFEYLTQKSEELSGGKVVANFIYKGTDEDKKNKLITLSLRNAPFTEVVRYVGQLTDTAFDYEEFAIVGKPVGAVQVPAATTTASGTPNTPPESKFDPPAGKEAPFPKAPQTDPFSKR